MMSQPSVQYLWTSLASLILFRFAKSFENSAYFNDPSVVYTYNRIPEIENECSPFLSSASELKPDDSRGYRLKKELSFFNGDWEQEIGGALLMPFDDSDMPIGSSSIISPLKLVDFEVKDVNPVHQLKSAVSLRGTMSIGIARNSSLTYDAYSNFYMSPGMSVLKISFEGVYIEIQENGGKRVLCMLGNTTLPFWNWIHDQSNRIISITSFRNLQDRLLPDDRILMVLHYPQTFNLTNRAIRGEIRSLNEQNSSKYFDLIRITSQLSQYSKYQFSSEKLQSRTCDQSSYKDQLTEDGANVFNNSEFCKSLHLFSDTPLNVVPDWRFSGRNGYGKKIGPFQLGQDPSYGNIKLIMQNLICDLGAANNNNHKARVAAVLRAFPATMERDTVAMRTGLSGMTLSVEGTWDTSTGQLCMVGCLGAVGSGLGGCDSQVSLYFPHKVSIKQRSTILGSISSNSNETGSYIPIFFLYEMHSCDLFDRHEQYSRSYQSYHYTKVAMASYLRKRNQPSMITAARQLVLTFPALQDKEDLFTSLDHLSYPLSIRAFAVPDPSLYRDKPEVFVKLQVLSVGPLFGRHKSWFYDSSSPVKEQAAFSKYELLNVSLSLIFTEAPLKFTEVYYKNMSSLFLEGLYDPISGGMYLIGCRKVTANLGSFNTERGLDCSVEGKIEYPAETMRWLIHPTARISITSQRNESDPLYFSPISLQTFVFPDDSYELDAVFRRALEESLRSFVVLVSILFILSQLIYLNRNVDATPYVSRTMLGIQSIGYGLPLIQNIKIVFQPKEYGTPVHNLYGYDHILDVLDYTGKLLALAAFILVIRLSRKVSESREIPRPGSPSISDQVPHEKKIILIYFAILLVGFICFSEHQWKLLENKKSDIASHLDVMGIATYKQQEYMGYVQDIFLLPQIIGNVLWQTPAKPLRKLYYIGFTLLRVLVHLYDCTRDPVINPFSEAADVNLRAIFTSGTEKMAVIVIMTVLSIVVYIQQKEPYLRRHKHLSFKST